MQRLMGFSLCLWKILSHINIPVLLSSVGSCTLYLQSCRANLPWKDFIPRTEGTLQLQARSREGWAGTRQDPSKSAPAFAVALCQMVSQFPWSRREQLGWAGLSQQRVKVPGLAVPKPAQDRAPRAEGGLAEGAKSSNLAMKDSSEIKNLLRGAGSEHPMGTTLCG